MRPTDQPAGTGFKAYTYHGKPVVFTNPRQQALEQGLDGAGRIPAWAAHCEGERFHGYADTAEEAFGYLVQANDRQMSFTAPAP